MNIETTSINTLKAHLAINVRNVDRSIEFYGRYAGMQVVHRRKDESTGHSVVWLSDLTRPFVIVLIEAGSVDQSLCGLFCHIGVGVRREMVAHGV